MQIHTPAPVPQTPVVKPSPTAHEHLAPKAPAAAPEPKVSRADELLRRVISTMGTPERLLEHQAAIVDAQNYLRSLAGS